MADTGAFLREHSGNIEFTTLLGLNGQLDYSQISKDGAVTATSTERVGHPVVALGNYREIDNPAVDQSLDPLFPPSVVSCEQSTPNIDPTSNAVDGGGIVSNESNFGARTRTCDCLVCMVPLAKDDIQTRIATRTQELHCFTSGCDWKLRTFHDVSLTPSSRVWESLLLKLEEAKEAKASHKNAYPRHQLVMFDPIKFRYNTEIEKSDCRISGCNWRYQISLLENVLIYDDLEHYLRSQIHTMQWAIKEHEWSHHVEKQPGGRLACKQDHCKYTTKRILDLKRHCKSKHCANPERLPCPVLWCKYSNDNNGFTRKDKLNSHLKNVHANNAPRGQTLKNLQPKIEDATS